MGLAYDLKVDLWSGVGDYLSNGIIDFAARDPNENMSFPQGDAFAGEGWMYRWCGTVGLGTEDSQAIFPTGEYIIRDITFMNGYYIMVGSYKAYFRDLYGAGSHGYAWDGFIMLLRGYSYNLAGLSTSAPFLYNATTKAYLGLNPELGISGWGFMPMRMPIDIKPGADATAAPQVSADSSVGLHSIDIAKGAEGVEVGAQADVDSANIKVITVGYQRVGDPVAAGMVYTNIDYIPFMWISQLQMFQSWDGIAEIYPVTGFLYQGGDPLGENYLSRLGQDPLSGNGIFYQVKRSATLQLSWDATTNYTLPLGFLSACQNTRLFDLKDWVGANGINTGGQAQWLPGEWAKGYQANGNDYLGVGPALPQDSSAYNWDMLPRRWLGVTSYSEQQAFGATAFQQSGAFQIVGDAYVGGDSTVATPVTTATVPMMSGCLYPSNYLALDYCQLAANDPAILGPFINQHIAGSSVKGVASGGQTCWGYAATYTEVLSFNGSYCTNVQIPYERMTFEAGTGDNPSDRQALRYYYVNQVKAAGGDLGCSIFTSEEIPQFPDAIVESLIAPKQFPTLVGQGYPDITKSKWYSCVAQSRTFTELEEERAKIVNYLDSNVAPYGGTQDPITIRNANNNEDVGVFGNYQRYGLDNDPLGVETGKFQQGNNSRQGFGGLSQSIDAAPQNEPIVYMFDSGRGWKKTTGYPVASPNYSNPNSYSNVVLNKGATFNDKFIIGKDSTTRKAVWGAWDNDRDQWLYIFSDTTNGVGVISATSTFAAQGNTDGFLDQTDNFTNLSSDVSTFKTALWNPFLMTNELDGLVIMGTGNRDNTSEDIFGYSGDGASNPYWVYAYGPTIDAQSIGGAVFGSNPFPATTIERTVSKLLVFNIKGTTGREAAVWVDYILFDGADALIATKLRERGMKVSIEAVEWFKRKIINSGDLNIKQEEIEEWMRQQQDEFQMMMRDAERMGRVRKKKKQVSAFGLDILDSINTDFEDKEVQEFMKEYLPKSRPPTPEEQMLERQRKGGYSPQTKSYFDEVFEN